MIDTNECISGTIFEKSYFKDHKLSLDIKRNILHVYGGKQMNEKQLPARVLQNFVAFLNGS